MYSCGKKQLKDFLYWIKFIELSSNFHILTEGNAVCFCLKILKVNELLRFMISIGSDKMCALAISTISLRIERWRCTFLQPIPC